MRRISTIIPLIIVSIFVFGCNNNQSVSDKALLNDLMIKAQNIKVISYDMSMVIKYNEQDGSEYTITGKGKTFLNEQRFRMENELNGLLSTVIALDNNELWSLDAETNTARMLDVRHKGMLASEWAYEDIKFISLIAQEEIDGHDCTVLRIEKNQQEPINKLWIRNDIGMPIKIETIIPGGGGDSLLLIYNISMDTPDDNLFEIPNYYTIE